MIKITIRDIGPIAEGELNIGKFNIVYGDTGSGKSFLMRLLYLLYISGLASSCFKGDLETIFSKFVLLDDNHPTSVLEMRENIVKTEVAKILLRSTSPKGLGDLSIRCSSDRSGAYIKASHYLLTCSIKQLCVHYVPQERSLPCMLNRLGYSYVNIARSIASMFQTSSASSLSPCIFLAEFFDMVMRQNMDPVTAFFVIELVLGLALHVIKESSKEGISTHHVSIGSESDFSLIFNLLTGSLRFLNKRLNVESSVSSLRTPQGALEYIIIELLHRHSRDLAKVMSNTFNENVPILFIVDEIGIHCDPMLKLKLVENLIKRSLESNNLYTIVTTHDPDILSKTLQVLEKNRDRYNVNDVKIHVLKYDENMRGYIGETIDLEPIENVIVPSKSIDILEKVARELSE